MFSLRHQLFADHQFFEKLLSRPQAGEYDVDVLEWFQPCQSNDLLGEVKNSYWLTHVENEYLPSVPHRCRLQDQLSSLGDRHEIPLGVGVSDGYRPAFANL